jgi:ABC-type branched-subunit amino acid transport system ATPase component
MARRARQPSRSASDLALLVEQNADLALALSDPRYVINNGSIAWTGEARAQRGEEALRVRLPGVGSIGLQPFDLEPDR